MKKIDPRIIKFINTHHVLTLSTCKDNIPYTANCFYVYDEELNAFIFTSDHDTKHISDVLVNQVVSGSVVLETKVIGKIRGLQFQGVMHEPLGHALKKVKKAYLKRFPVAMLMKTTLWTVELTYLKYTDNRLGFGKKLFWGEEYSVKITKE